MLGLPGAAIRLGNGKYLRSVGGKRILSVAHDERRHVTAYAIDESGQVARTEADQTTLEYDRVIALIE